MRQQRIGLNFPGFSPMVRNILIFLAAVFIIFALIGRTRGGLALYEALELDPVKAVDRLEIWRLLSYAALHDLSSPFHLIFNGMLFFFIGPDLEYRWGRKRFLSFVLLTALGGGIFVCIAYLLGLSVLPVVGFSAVTFGILIAWGLTFSERVVLVLGLFPLTGKQIVWVCVGFQLLYAVTSNNTSSAAHFGGMGMGAILTLGLWRPSQLKLRLGLSRRNRPKNPFR